MTTAVHETKAGQEVTYLEAISQALDEEMTRHGWFAADGSPKILFDTPTDERWSASFMAEGIDPRLLASETGVA